MLDYYEQGHDQIIARRTREGDKKVRSVLSRLYYRGVNRWVDVELTDGVGDFRMLSRPAVDALLSLPEYNRFSKGLFSWIGFDTVHFDYRNAQREADETKWKFGALLNYAMDGLISFNNRPLRLGIWLGTSLVALTGLYALWITVMAMTYGVDSPGYVTLVAMIVGIGGVQMVMLGLIGEYIGRIYYESKRRPHFLVKEAHGADPLPGTSRTAPGNAARTGPPDEPQGAARPDPPLRPGGRGEHRHVLRHLPAPAPVDAVLRRVHPGLRAVDDRVVLHEHLLHLPDPADLEEVPPLPLTNVTNYVIQSVGLYALVTWAGMDTRIAPLVAAVVAIPFTFLLSRKILVPGAARTEEARQAETGSSSRV